MSADIISLNLNPNIQWWIKLGPSGGQGLVEFFTTQADRDADTNRIAYGTFAFGEEAEIVLSQDAETPVISLFNDQENWHCIATLFEEDEGSVFAIGPYTDKPEVIDPLLASAAARADRSRREIDEGTHTRLNRDLPLGVHIQGLEVGDLDQLVRIESINIHGDEKSLVDTIRTVEFLDVTR